MTSDEFAGEFPRESPYVERKTGISGTAIQEAAVAFSNSDGGVVLIGVDDSGDVLGREFTQGTQDDLHRIMRSVHDPGRYALHALGVDGRPIVVLSIDRRRQGFSQTSQGRVMVRRGTHKVALFGHELREFINARTLQRFEATPVDATFADVSAPALEMLAATFRWSEPASYRDRLVERAMLDAEPPYRLTVAGALYLLDDPARVLGKAYIEILRYPGESTDYDRRVEVRGPLPAQVVRSAEFVIDELGSELVVLGLRRYELPRLPAVVLREAIANAVAHRSYELNGVAIRIELRPDSVVITSPGGLPEPVTVENLRETQAARNLQTIRVLREFGLAEDAGRGIDVMEDSMREEMLDPPRFADSGHAVEVSLPVRSAVAPAERAWVREVEDRGMIEPGDRIALVHAARGERLTNARVRELLGLDQGQARQVLHRLRDAGLLTQHGHRGGATYALADSLSPPPGLRLSRAQLHDLVLRLGEEGPITNAAVRAGTGLDRVEALALLDELVAQRRLVRTGQRRGTRYLLAPERVGSASRR